MKKRLPLMVLALLMIFAVVTAPDAKANCPATWEECRATATRLYFGDQIGTYRYYAMLQACEVEYLACVFGVFAEG